MVEKYYQKIMSSKIFEGFIPRDQYFDFDDVDPILKKVKTEKVLRKQLASVPLTDALNNELYDRVE